MLTLAINTASFTESVALFTEKKILAEINWRGKSDESEKLLPTILKLLKRANKKWSDVKRIIVVNGPGPFSAVRIGVTTANVLGFALKIPVFSISSEKLWRQREPKKNAILLLHAGGNFVAVHKDGQKPTLYKITELPKTSILFYGDLTPDELNELKQNKNARFIPEKSLKSFSETVFNVKLSLLRKRKSASATAGQAKPIYWRPPNITKPKK